jgi:hypothetical protein
MIRCDRLVDRYLQAQLQSLDLRAEARANRAFDFKRFELEQSNYPVGPGEPEPEPRHVNGSTLSVGCSRRVICIARPLS